MNQEAKVWGQIAIPAGQFLKEVKGQYSNPAWKLAAEMVQNAFDAGAKTIMFSFDDENGTITVDDDGNGMSEDTLLNAYLALGGTYKPSANSIGAFGEAKKLTFAMQWYEIYTRNFLVKGIEANYQLFDGVDFLKGTTFILAPPKDKNRTFDYNTIKQTTKKCLEEMEIPMTLILDGEEVKCSHKKGKLVKSLKNIGDLYLNKDRDCTNYMPVRISGLVLYSEYINKMEGAMTLELTGNSAGLLTSNRENLNFEYRNTVQKFLSELAQDREEALHPEKVKVEEVFDGKSYSDYVLDKEDLEHLRQRYVGRDFSDIQQAMTKLVSLKGLSANLFATRLETMKKETDNANNLLAYLDKLAYLSLDFGMKLQFEEGQREEVYNFIGGTKGDPGSKAKAKKAKTLLTIWGENIKQVLIDSGMYHKFDIAFTWDRDADAAIGKDTYYINPRVLERYSLVERRKLGKELHHMARHEVAHFLMQRKGWGDGHNNDHEQEMRSLERRGWDSEKEYSIISKLK